jgi:drug/metabolite transporter (DMT)-like permease
VTASHPGGQAVLLGLASSALWGSADFSGGLAARRTEPAFVIAIAHALSLVILLAAAIARHDPLHTSEIVYGLLSGLVGGLGLIALYNALSLGSMGLTAAVCGVVSTIFPVVASWFREGHAGGTRLTGFAIAGLAIWLIAYTPGDKPHPRGLGLAVVAGIFFGIMLVLMRIAAAQSVLWALTWTRVASTAVGAAASLVMLLRGRPRRSPGSPAPGSPVPGAKSPWRTVLLLAALVGLLDTSGNLLYMLAALAGRLDVAAVLSALYPGTTMLLALLLLKERTTRSQGAGMVLALVAVALIAI